LYFHIGYFCGTYYLYFIQYNPKFVLWIALIQNLIGLIYKLFFDTFLVAFLLAIIILFMKLIPLYTLYLTKITKKDIYFTIVLFIVYNSWIYINETNLYEILIELKNNKGPLMASMMSRI